MKNIKDTIRGFALGVALTSLVAAVPTAIAASGKKSIDVVYSDITMMVDGVKVVPKDVKGNVVEPFIYDGTTYLPLRAAVNAITGGSKAVDWEQSTRTIYIGGKPAAEKVDMSTLKTYPDNYPAFKAYEGEGDKITIRQQDIMPFNRLRLDEATFLLGGDYATLQCSVGVLDGYSLEYNVTFIDADSKAELKTVTVKHGEAPVNISVDVTGVDKLTIKRDDGYMPVVFNAVLIPIPRA